MSCDFRFHYFDKKLVDARFVDIFSKRPNNLKGLNEASRKRIDFLKSIQYNFKNILYKF